MTAAQLTPAQARMLAEVREAGERRYNGRARSQVLALDALGLVEWDYTLRPDGLGRYTELYTVRPAPEAAPEALASSAQVSYDPRMAANHTPQEGTMQELLTAAAALVAECKAATYGTPEAKALIKRAKATEDELYAQGNARRAAEREAAEAEGRATNYSADSLTEQAYRIAWQLKCARLDLNTVPLPVASSWLLPAQARANDEHLVQGPQDVAAYGRGDLVAVHSRGMRRDALVVSVGKTNLVVAYTTATALREAQERKVRYPDTSPTETRKTVKVTDLYDHRPGRDASDRGRPLPLVPDMPGTTTPAAPAATNREEAPVATSTKKGDKAAKAKAPKHPTLTVAQAEAEMAKAKPAFDAYEKARIQLRDAEDLSAAARTKLERTMEDNRPGFSTYWRLYNDPRIAEKRRKAREQKKAKAEAEAAGKKAPAKTTGKGKGKAEAAPEAPAEAEGFDPNAPVEAPGGEG